jgi:hypothetical protein
MRDLNKLIPEPARSNQIDSIQLAAKVSEAINSRRSLFRAEDGSPAEAIAVSGIPVEMFLNP